MLKSLRVAIGILSLMMLLTGGFGCSRPSATTTTSNTQTTTALTTPPVSTSYPPTTTIPVTTTSTPPTTSMTTMPTTTTPPTTTTKPPPTTSVTPPPTTTGSTVIVSGYTFSPDPILVRVGTRVVWKNLDAADHTVTSVSPGIFDNPLPSLGETSITFTVPGKYDYICTIHPYMTGSVIVS